MAHFFVKVSLPRATAAALLPPEAFAGAFFGVGSCATSAAVHASAAIPSIKAFRFTIPPSTLLLAHNHFLCLHAGIPLGTRHKGQVPVMNGPHLRTFDAEQTGC